MAPRLPSLGRLLALLAFASALGCQTSAPADKEASAQRGAASTPPTAALDEGDEEPAAERPAREAAPAAAQPTPRAAPDPPLAPLQENGKMRMLWKDERTLAMPPTAWGDGVLACFVDGEKSSLLRLRHDGTEVWRRPLEGRCTSPPLCDGQAVYIRVSGVGVVALAWPDGAEKWVSQPSPEVVGENPIEDYDFAGRWPTFALVRQELILASGSAVHGVSLEDGATRWSNAASNFDHAFAFATAPGPALVKAGAPSPYTSTSSSSVWGFGDTYAIEPSRPHLRRVATRDDLRETVASSGTANFATAPRALADAHYVLVQGVEAQRPASIRYVEGRNGRRQAVGGSLDVPGPVGISLVRLVDAKPTEAARVTADLGHQLLATGGFTSPVDALLSAGDLLLFTTANEDGDSIALQAWGADLQRRWHVPGLMLLGASAQLVIAGTDKSDPQERSNAPYFPEGEGELVALDLAGKELGRLPIPFQVLGMPFGAVTSNGVLYLTTPKRQLWGVALGE